MNLSQLLQKNYKNREQYIQSELSIIKTKWNNDAKDNASKFHEPPSISTGKFLKLYYLDICHEILEVETKYNIVIDDKDFLIPMLKEIKAASYFYVFGSSGGGNYGHPISKPDLNYYDNYRSPKDIAGYKISSEFF